MTLTLQLNTPDKYLGLAADATWTKDVVFVDNVLAIVKNPRTNKLKFNLALERRKLKNGGDPGLTHAVGFEAGIREFRARVQGFGAVGLWET